MIGQGLLGTETGWRGSRSGRPYRSRTLSISPNQRAATSWGPPLAVIARNWRRSDAAGIWIVLEQPLTGIRSVMPRYAQQNCHSQHGGKLDRLMEPKDCGRVAGAITGCPSGIVDLQGSQDQNSDRSIPYGPALPSLGRRICASPSPRCDRLIATRHSAKETSSCFEFLPLRWSRRFRRWP